MSTLETIPEDTSKTTPKITSSESPKIKDPVRVAAGKRLAAISKDAKEKKAREKFEAEVAAEREENSWNIDFGFIVRTVGILTAVGALYFAYIQEQCDIERSEEDRRETIHRSPAAPTVVSRLHRCKQPPHPVVIGGLDTFD